MTTARAMATGSTLPSIILEKEISRRARGEASGPIGTITIEPIEGSAEGKVAKAKRSRKATAVVVAPIVRVAGHASGELPTTSVAPIEGVATGGATARAEIGSFVMLAHDRRAPWRTEWRNGERGGRNAEREAYVARLRNRRAA